MSEERTLANIAKIAYWDTESENKDTFDRVAKAVEKEVLERFKNDEEEPIAGQELTIGQAAKIAEDHGSTEILEYFNDDLSRFMPCGYNNCIYLGSRYRVAPKIVNNPATWEKGVAIFVRNSENDAWVLDVFKCYKKDADFKYATNVSEWRYAKLATPKQIEAWKLINDDSGASAD